MTKTKKIEERILVLKEFEFFKGIETLQLKDIVDNAEIDIIYANTKLNNFNGGLNSFYLVLSGKIKEYHEEGISGKQLAFFILQKGDVFDLMNLLDKEPHHMLWETIETTEVLKVSKDYMRKWILKNPKMHCQIYHYLGEKIRAVENKASDLAIHKTLVRLGKILLSLIQGRPRQLKLINNLSDNEIANLVGTTRAVLNRHLQELKKMGIIEIGYKKIKIKNVEELIKIAEGDNIL